RPRLPHPRRPTRPLTRTHRHPGPTRSRGDPAHPQEGTPMPTEPDSDDRNPVTPERSGTDRSAALSDGAEAADSTRQVPVESAAVDATATPDDSRKVAPEDATAAASADSAGASGDTASTPPASESVLPLTAGGGAALTEAVTASAPPTPAGSGPTPV